MSAFDRFQCPNCYARLLSGAESMRCVECQRQYPIILGVPMLVPNVDIQPASSSISEGQVNSVCEAFGIEPDAKAHEFLSVLFSYSYHFDDLALDSENNYLLNRLDLQSISPRKPISLAGDASSNGIQYRIVRHYLPNQLQAGGSESYNVRLRNTGLAPIGSTAESGHVLSSHWTSASGAVSTNPETCSLPMTLLPGREISVPMYFNVPTEPGGYVLRIGFGTRNEQEWHSDPLDFPITVRDRVEHPYVPLVLEPGPKFPDYDEDHREGVRILEQAVKERGSRLGLEIGGCSTPMSTNLPCEIVNTDVDAQTLQIGRFVLARRGHSNVTFVCCDAHNLPFQPRTFDFVAVFAALHHFSDPLQVLKRIASTVRTDGFVAIMCEPTGHYHLEPDPGMKSQLVYGINEQRFSLQEYERLFYEAGLKPMRAQLDEDSLKVILLTRS